MKIECDKCAAKYSIADDKVRGKTFKIRCKKCSNVIIVRDKAGAEDGGDAPAEEPGWHLAIGGETVGPISEAEVRERFAAGEIDKDTSVWQEGFEDWLPLSEVTAFSDMADRPASGGHAAAAAAPDPFAGGGDDDYSAPSSSPASSPSSGGDFLRSPEPAHSPAAATPASSGPTASAAASGSGASPRVSALTGARNENSVLFSLDSLSSMAMGKPGGGGGGGGAPAPGPSFSLGSSGGGGGGGAPTPSPTGNSEGSGLIDIRAMSGMMGSGGGGGGGGGGGDEGRDDSMLPSFGGTGFGGLSAAPLLVTPTTPAVENVPAPEPQRASNTPLYVLMVIVLLGMGGMAYYIFTRPPPTPETKIVEVIKSVPVKDTDEDEDKPRKKKKDEEADDEGEEEAGEPVDAAPDDKKGTAAKTTTKKVDKKADKTGEKTPVVDDKTEPKKEVKKEEKKEDYSVDCILDPSKCGGSKKSGDSGAAKPPVDSSLPEKLELSDIQAGVNPVKANAKSNCAKHSKGGEKVSIKLSISGPTGNVLSSSVVDAAGNDQLANCVAAELKKATFKKVKKEQIGTQVSVGF